MGQRLVREVGPVRSQAAAGSQGQDTAQGRPAAERLQLM